MNTSISVEQCVGHLAEECIAEWTTKASDHCNRVFFKAALAEGNRREGLSFEMFEHIWSALSAMPCWKEGEVDKPWISTVIYDIPPNMLEKDVEDLRKESYILKTTLECDDQGNNAQQIVAYLKTPPLRLGIATHAAIDVCIERQCGTRNYIKKEANYNKIMIDVSKKLTFHEHFDWHYEFTLRYREPYFNTHDLMEDVVDKDIIFRDPPVCLFHISCDGVKDTHDHAYFADSFLCKVMDILPPSWRSIPIHVKTTK